MLGPGLDVPRAVVVGKHGVFIRSSMAGLAVADYGSHHSSAEGHKRFAGYDDANFDLAVRDVLDGAFSSVSNL